MKIRPLIPIFTLVTASAAVLSHAQKKLDMNAGYKIPYQITGRRNPIVSRDIPRIDVSGRVVDSNVVIRLKNGKAVPAGQYFDKVNQLEKKLNAMGYSITTAENQQIGGFQVKPQDTQNATNSLLKSITNSGNTDKLGSEGFRSKPLIPPQAGSQNGYVNPRYFGHYYHSGIKPRIAYFGVDADWDFAAQGTLLTSAKDKSKSTTNFDLKGSFTVTAQAWNASTNVVDANFGASCGGAQKARLFVNCNVAGNQLLNFDESYPDNWSKSDTISYPVNYGAADSGEIVPGVYVVGIIGFIGNAGINYDLKLSPGGITGDLTPFAYAKVYAQAGVGLGLSLDDLSAGLEGGLMVNMTVVNESMPFHAQLGISSGVNGQKGLGLLSLVSIKNHATLLSGTVDAYFSEDLGPTTYQQTKRLFGYDGVNWDATLFERSGFIKL